MHCRDYHSGVVSAKREKDIELKMDDRLSVTDTSQDPCDVDDLAVFQSEHSAKTAAALKGKDIHKSRII